MKELETVVQDEKNKWILITGILQVLACVIMNKFDISNPNIILFVILSAVLVQFGYGAGMLCGFITYIYSMYFFSTDHSFFYFDASNRDKIIGSHFWDHCQYPDRWQFKSTDGEVQ